MRRLASILTACILLATWTARGAQLQSASTHITADAHATGDNVPTPDAKQSTKTVSHIAQSAVAQIATRTKRNLEMFSTLLSSSGLNALELRTAGPSAATALSLAQRFAPIGLLTSMGLMNNGRINDSPARAAAVVSAGEYHLPAGTFKFDSDIRIPFGSSLFINPGAIFSGAGNINVAAGYLGQAMPIFSNDYMSATYGPYYAATKFSNVFNTFRAVVSNVQNTPIVALMGNAVGGADGTQNTKVWGINGAAGAESAGSTAIGAEIDFGIHTTPLASSIGIQLGTNSYVDNLIGSFLRLQGSTQGRTGHGIYFDGSTGGAQIYYDLIKTVGMMNPLQGIDFSLSRFANYEINTPSFAVIGTQGISFVGTLISGSTSVSAVTKTRLLQIGNIVRGTGVSDGTTVTAIDTTNGAITLSKAATASVTNVALFEPLPSTQVRVQGGGPESSPSLGPVTFGTSTKTADSFTVSSLGNGLMRVQTGDQNTKMTLSSNGSVTLGQNNAVVGAQSAAIGAQHSLKGTANVAIGYGASDRGVTGKVVTANGFFSNRGDTQVGTTIMRGQTTNASAVQLTSNGVTANNVNVVNIPDYTNYSLTVSCEARDATATANSYTAKWFGAHVMTRDNGVSTLALDGGTTTVVPDSARTLGTAIGETITIAADQINSGLAIVFTPPAKNIDTWHLMCRVNTDEVQ